MTTPAPIPHPDADTALVNAGSALPITEDRSVSMGAANVYALLLMGPVCAALAAAFVGLHGGEALWDGAGRVFGTPLTFVAVFLVGVVVHEAIHGVAWKLASGEPWRALRFGVQLKTLTPYAHCTEPMSARAYRAGAAAPGVALGLAPVLVALVTGNGALAAFGLFFTLAAGGDALVLWLLRGVAPDRLVADHPTLAGCLVLAPTGAPTDAVPAP